MHNFISKRSKNIIDRLVVLLLIASILFGSLRIPTIFGENVASPSTAIRINSENYLSTSSDADYEINLQSEENEEVSGDFKYILRDGKAIITGLSDDFTGNSINIPNDIDGHPVEEIKDRAFYIRGIENVVLGDNLKKIDEYAFAGNNISSIIFPDSLEEIGSNAFRDNILSSINLNHIKKVDREAFINNILSSLSLGDRLEEIGDGAFKNNNITSVNIPDTLTSVGEDIFADNNKFVKVISTSEDISIPKIQKKEGSFGYVINPIILKIKFIDKDTGANLLDTITVGDDLASLNDVYAKGVEQEYKVPALPGYKIYSDSGDEISSINFTPDTDPYELSIEYVKKRENINLVPKNRVFPKLNIGETDVETVLRSFIEATDERGTDLSARVSISPTDIDTSVEGALHEVFYSLRDDESGETKYLSLKVYVGTDMNNFPLGNDWTLGDFVYGGDRNVFNRNAFEVSGLSESGKIKIQTNKEVVLPHINPRTGDRITKVSSHNYDQSARFQNKGITSITSFDGGITTIGWFAFRDNPLTTIENMPNITKVEDNAFYNVSTLTDFDFSKVTSIGPWAFFNTGIKNVIAPELIQVEFAAFHQSQVGSDPDYPDAIYLPKLEKIGEHMFSKTKMKYINQEKQFPNATIIGKNAFREMPGRTLTSVSIPNVTKVEAGAFSWNWSIVDLYAPDLVTIENDAFSVNAITNVDLPNAKTLGVSAFWHNAIENLSIPEVVTIDGNAFKENKLKDLNLPKVESIGQYAFENNLIPTVTAPMLKSIDIWAFWNNNNVDANGDGAPDQNPGLKVLEYNIPIYTNQTGVLSRENYIINPVEEPAGDYDEDDFIWDEQNPTSKVIGLTTKGKAKLISNGFVLNLPDNVTEVGAYAFNFENIRVLRGANVKKVETGAFQRNDFESIELQNLEEAGEKSFAYSKAFDATTIKSLSLPKLKTVGRYAFEQVGMESLDIPLLEETKEGAFYNNRIKTINAPVLKTLAPSSFQNNNFTRVTHENFPALESISYRAFTANPVEILEIPNVTFSYGSEEFRFGNYRTKPVIWQVPEGISSNNNNKKAYGDSTFDVFFNTDRPNNYGDWFRSEPGGIILTAPPRADGTLDRTNPDGWLETIKEVNYYKNGILARTKYRSAIINPSTVKVNYRLEDGTSFDGINGRPNVADYREYIYEELDRDTNTGTFKATKTYTAPNIAGYVLVKTTNVDGVETRGTRTVEVPFEEEGVRTDREITFTYRKIEKSTLPGPTLKYGIGASNSTTIVGDSMEYMSNGNMPQMLTRFDISQVQQPIKKGKIQISFDKPYINPSLINLSNSAATNIWYNENAYTATDTGMEITLNENIPAGAALNAAISYRFKWGETPEGANVKLKMTLIDEDDSGVEQIIAESDFVNLKIKYTSPIIKVRYQNNLAGYYYTNDDSYNGPRNMGSMTGDIGEKRVVDNPEVREFYYTLENITHKLSAISLRTVLPTYTAIEADGSEIEKMAQFDPALNPDWTLAADGKSVIFNKNLTIPTKDINVLNRSISSLKLRFAGAKDKTPVTNKTYAYLTPNKDLRDAAIYPPMSAVGDMGEGDSLTVWPLYIKLPEYSFRDVGGGKTNGLTPRSLYATAYLYDIADDKKKEITYKLGVWATNENTDFKDVSIIDYDLDPRLKYTELRFDTTPAQTTNISILGYRKVGDNINPSADTLVFERDATVDSTRSVAFGDIDVDYLQIKILGTEETPLAKSLNFTMITKLRNPDDVLFNVADESQNVLINRALILGNQYQKGTDREKPSRPEGEKYANITENTIIDSSADVKIYKYKSYVGIDKKLSDETNPKAYPSYPSIDSGEVVLEGQRGAYHISLNSMVEGNPFDTASDVLENLEIIDVLPEAISVNTEDIILDPTFIRAGGSFELIPDYTIVENGRTVSRVAIKFKARNLDMKLYNNKNPKIAIVKTKYLATTTESVLTNKVYATWDNANVVAQNPATNGTDNIDSSGNVLPTNKNPYAYNTATIKVVRSTALLGQLFIRNKTDNNWQESINTKSDEQFDYKMVISNYDNSAEGSTYAGLDIINVLPAIDDQMLNKQGARGSEFENKIDITRLSDIRVPAGYSIQYYNTDTSISDILAGTTNMDDVGNDSSINWENAPAANTKMIRIKANPGVVLSQGDSIAIEIPMVAPHIANLNDIKLGKKAIDSYVFRFYENNTSTYGKFTEPNRVYNTMEAASGSYSFVKYAKEGRLLSNDTASPIAGAGFELLDRDNGNALLAVAYSDENGLVKFDNLITNKNYAVREFAAPADYLLNSNFRYFGKADFQRAENNNYDIVLTESESKNSFMNIKDIRGSLTINKTARDTSFPLSNVSFRIKGLDTTNNTFDTTLATGENGQIVLTDLSEGRYSIEEIESSASNRYQKVNNITVNINASNVNAVVNVVNDKFQVLFRKIVVNDDSLLNPATWDTLTDFQKKKLPNYRFRVVGDDGTSFTSNNTGTDGSVILKNLKTEVVYTVTELPTDQQAYANKDLYTHNTNEYKFKISHDGKLINVANNKRFKQYALNIPNKPKELKGSVVVKKVDKDDNTIALEGAKIAIYKINIVDGVTNLTKVGDDKITALDGNDALVKFENLEPGNYQIKEIEPPAGYILNTTPIDVNIPSLAPEGNNPDYNKSGDNIIYTATKTLTNKALKVKGLKGSDVAGYRNMPTSAARIYVDSKRAEIPNINYRIIGSNFASVYIPVAGAKFELYKMENGAKVGSAIPINGSTDIISGVDGEISFGDYKFEYNTEYGIFETETIDGYELNTGYKSFKISDEAKKAGFNGEYSFYINNEVSKGEIAISKYDSVEKRNLAGVRFNLYQGDRNTADFTKVFKSVVTGDDGIAYFPRLSYGKYVVREAEVPSGYKQVTQADDIEVTLSEDSPIFKKKVFNTKLIDINVKKVWQRGSESSVKVKLLRSTSRNVQATGNPIVIDGFTDENGFITLNRDNNWNLTYQNLDMADNNGNIYYFIPVEEEITDARYQSIITGTKETGFIITNVATDEASIGVTKNWIFGDSTRALTGSKVRVELKRVTRGGIIPAVGDVTQTLQTVELDASNNWQYVFSGLALREWGENIIYRVEEVGLNEGFKPATYTYDATTKNMSISNEAITRNINVEKKWVNVDPTLAPNVSIQVFDSEDMNTPLLSAVPSLENGKYIAKFENIPSYAYTLNQDGSINGRKIKYKLKEKYTGTQERTGYTSTNDIEEKYTEYSQDANMSADVEAIMTNTLKTTGIKIEKLWDGIEVAQAPDVQLQIVDYTADRTVDKTDTATHINVGSIINLNATDGFTKTIQNLPKYKPDGITEIDYGIKELNTGLGYTLSKDKTLDADNNIKFTLTNTRKKVLAKITKTWNMTDSLYIGETVQKPEVNLHLWADLTDDANYDVIEVRQNTYGNPLPALVLNERNNYSINLSDLPKYTNDGNNLIKYYVTEEAITGFRGPTTPVELQMNAEGILSANINNVQEKFDINVEKRWVGLEKYEASERENTPEVHIDLYTEAADGSQKLVTGRSVSLVRDTTDTSLFTASFTNLPKYDLAGNEINYKLRERENLAGYEVSYSEPEVVDLVNKKYTVTNTVKEQKVVVNKNWVGKSENSIAVQLLRDNVVKANTNISANADGLYTYTFEHLPMYAIDGHTRYAYSIGETPINGYETDIREVVGTDESIKNFTITNTYMTVDINISKTFVGVAEADRPQVRLQLIDETDADNKLLIANKIVSLNEDNNFSATLEDLPKFKDDGTTLIRYNVVEVPALVGYEFSTTASFSAVADTNAPYGTWTIDASNTRLTQDIVVAKEWALDTSNYTRPSVKFDLLADATDDGIDNPISLGETEVGEASDWKLKKTLPRYAADGRTLIKYYVRELPLDGYNIPEGNILLNEDTSNTYTPTRGNNSGKILSSTLTNRLKVVNVEVEKVWSGLDKYTNTRNLPNIHVELIDVRADETKVVGTPKLVSLDNGVWKAKFEDVPQYRDDGITPIYYDIREVEEATLPGYIATKEREALANGDVKITLTNTVKTRKIRVRKSWIDVDPNEAPEVRVRIIDEDANSDIDLSNAIINLNQDNAWTNVAINLPRYHADGSTEVNYEIQEVTDLPGYNSEHAWNPISIYDEAIILLTNNRVYRPISLKKLWEDDNSGYTRPDVTFKIYANNNRDDATSASYVRDVVLSATDNFTSNINLPKYAPNGVDEIHYYVEEVVPQGYSSNDGRKPLVLDAEVLKAEITNKLIIRNVIINHEWKDMEVYKNTSRGNVPNLHVEIYDITDGIDNARRVGTRKQLVLDTDGIYKTKYENLPKYKEDGREIRYMVKEIEEDELLGYRAEYKTPEVDGDDNIILKIENRPVKIEIKARKTWIGTQISDAPQVRLGLVDSTRVQDVDLRGKVLSLNFDNGFSGSFGQLPKYNVDGITPINYTLEELDSKLGYTFRQAKTEGIQIELEAINERVGTSASLSKTWIENGTQYEKPEVEFKLYAGNDINTANEVTTLADGSPIGRIILSDSSNWLAIVNNLPKYDASGENLLTYYVEEVPVDGYRNSGRVALVSGLNGILGGNIENELVPTNVIVEQTFAGIEAYNTEFLDRLPSIEVDLYDITDDTNPIKLNKRKRLVKDTSGKWVAKYENLPKYKSDGVTEIKYGIGDISSYDGYIQSTPSREILPSGDTKISFVETLRTTTLNVKKKWAGVDENLAPSVRLKLLDKDAINDIREVGNSIDLDRNINYEYEYLSLPKYHIDGSNLVRYGFEELNQNQAYIFSEDKYEVNGDSINVELLNTRLTYKTKIRKLWASDNSGYERPEVHFTLYKKENGNYLPVSYEKDGQIYDNITLNSAMNYVIDIDSLPKYNEAGDRIIEYYIKEAPLAGYKYPQNYIKLESLEDDSLYAEATNEIETRGIKAIKHWTGLEGYSEEDLENLANVHAVLYDITDTKKRVATLQFTKDTSGEYTAIFENYPKYKIDGTTSIVYEVEELEAGSLDGYETTYTRSEEADGNLIFEVENKVKTGDVSVTKTWRVAPFLVDKVEVYLTKDGKKIGDSVTLTPQTNWSYTFRGIPEYEADGITKIKYAVKEVEVFAYKSHLRNPSGDGKTFELYNVYTGIVKGGDKTSTSVVNRFSSSKLEQVPGEPVYEEAKNTATATESVAERVREKVSLLIPKTGDKASARVYIVAFVFAGLSLIILILRKKDTKKEE